MLYSITVGDWSNDGHGMTQVQVVEIDGATEEELTANYFNNIEKYGIDPRTICRDYEEYEVDPDVAERIEAHVTFPEGESVIDRWDDTISLRDGYEAFFEIMMFLLTAGLDCVWSQAKITSLAPGPLGHELYGYGLLGN